MSGTIDAPNVPPRSRSALRRVTFTALVAYLGCSIATSAAASAWVPQKGALYLQLGGSLSRLDEPLLLGPSGLFAPEVQTWAFEAYGDVGLGANLALRAATRWVAHEAELGNASTLTRSGLQDLEATIAWGPIHGAHAVAFWIGGRAPLYETSPADGIRIGPGGGDVLFGAAYGHGFGTSWYQVSAQQRLRFGGASSGIDLRGELGSALTGPIKGLLTLHLAPAFGRDQDRAPDQPSPVPSVLALGGKLLLQLPANFGAVAEATWMPKLLNDGPGLRFALGLSWQYY